MKCPECGNEMEESPVVMATIPPIEEFYCKNCNAIWDYDGEDIWECFKSPRREGEP